MAVSQAEREKYHLLAVGPYSDEAIKISFQKEKQLTPAEMAAKAFVDQEVQKVINGMNEKRREQGKKEITDQPKLRLDKIVERDGNCEIRLDPEGTSYGRHVALSKEEDLHAVYDRYTSSVNSDYKLTWEEFKDKFQPRPLTVLVGVVTSDGKLLVDQRNPKKVATYPHAFHGIGGYIETSDVEVDEEGKGTISTTSSVIREALEEGGVPPSSLKAIVCLGAMMHEEPGLPRYPELVFLARTSMRGDQIIDDALPLGDVHRMKLSPRDPDGYMKAKDLFNKDGSVGTLLPALLHIDKFFEVEGKGHEVAATFPSTKAMAFLLYRLIQESVPKAFRISKLKN